MDPALKARTYLEICTDSEDDWEASLALFAKSFQNSEAFLRTHHDPEKRRRFLIEYFKYIYETELSNGRSGLACVKLLNGGDSGSSDPIIYAFCALYGKQVPTPGEKTLMRNIDERAMELNLSQDEWVEEAIHAKFRRLSKELKFSVIHEIYHATAEEYKGRGIAKYYAGPSAEAIYKDGLRRGKIDKNLPTFEYGIVDDIRAKGLQKAFGNLEIAHLHEARLDGGGANCVDDPNFKKEESYDCVFLYGHEIGRQTGLVEKINQYFSLC